MSVHLGKIQTQPTQLAYDPNDYLSDETYNSLTTDEIPDDHKNERLSDRETKKLCHVMDDTESATLSILIRFQNLVDGKNRKTLEAVTAMPIPEEESHGFHEYRFNPFRQETNFDEQGLYENPADAMQAVKKVISGLATMLFGIEVAKESKKSLADWEESLTIDKTAWEKKLSNHYKNYFVDNIKEAFIKADLLLAERKKYANSAAHQRVMLFACVIITAIGFFIGKRVLAYAGLGATTLTFLYMLSQYGSYSFKQGRIAADLQTSSGFLEKIGYTNRIT